MYTEYTFYLRHFHRAVTLQDITPTVSEGSLASEPSLQPLSQYLKKKVTDHEVSGPGSFYILIHHNKKDSVKCS